MVIVKQLRKAVQRLHLCTTAQADSITMDRISTNDMNGFGNLPDGVLAHILDNCFISKQEAITMRGVCRRWRDAFDESVKRISIRTSMVPRPSNSRPKFPTLQHLVISYTSTAPAQAALELSAEYSSTLTTLELSYCSLPKVPPIVSCLQNLDTLVISNSHLKTLGNSGLHLLSHLRHLDLSGNELVEMPACIGSLGALQMLNLCDNHLECLPEGIGGLTALQTLRASNNLLLELPEHLGQLQNLKCINLSFNRLKSLPEHITRLTKLQQISVFAGFSHSIRNEGSSTVRILAHLSLDAPEMRLQAEEVVLGLVRLRKKQLQQARQDSAAVE